MLLRTSTCRRRTSALLLTAALALTAAGPAARADTESDLRDAMAEVEALQQAAAQAHERDEAARARLAAVTARLADLDVSLIHAQAELAQSRRTLGRAARATYMAGGIEDSWYLLLSADAGAFGRGINDLRRVTDGAAADLRASRRTTQDVAMLRSRFAAETALAADLQKEAARAAQEAANALDEAVRREDDLQRRFAAEVAEQRAEQQAQARREAAAALQALAAPSAVPGPGPVPGPTAEPGQGPQFSSSGEAGQRIVAWALDRVGARYVLNAEGPDAFDCSGFVTAAYATIGLAVPSYTGAQADLVTAVPLSQIRPGDLLFYFGRGAHHVAIYIGDGRMVHAVNPARGVTVNRLSDAWYRERFTMAGRLID